MHPTANPTLTDTLKHLGTALLIALTLLAAYFVFTQAERPTVPEGSQQGQVQSGSGPRIKELEQPSAWAEAHRNLQGLDTVATDPGPTGYDRVRYFGTSWPDLDGDDCSEREEILARDFEQTQGPTCRITSGTLHDPYTGQTIDFTRGVQTSGEVQIDHVVALADAWSKGAEQWDQQVRLRFANDPQNLLAVDGRTNAAKSASDASQWLPPNEDFWCEYVTAQVQIKDKYELGVSAAEKQALEKVLVACLNERPMPELVHTR